MHPCVRDSRSPCHGNPKGVTAPTARRIVGVFTAFAFGFACAVQHPMAYQSAIAVGDRAYAAGRMSEASEAFDRAAVSTQNARDRDEAVYLAAGAAFRAGDIDRALTRYDSLANVRPAGERAPRAALEASRIRRSRHETARADNELLEVVQTFPATGPARRALDLLMDDTDAADPTLRRSLTLLDRLANDRSLRSLQDAVLMYRAQRLERSGDLPSAIAGYRQLLDTVAYPYNTHWDDGGLALVRLLQATGDPRGAVEVADRVLAVREVSYGNGDYEAPHFGDIAMLRARIYRDDLHNPPAAVRAFHFVYSSFVSSRLRDDALWDEATTRTAMGDTPGACGVYVTLAREFACTHAGRASIPRVLACGHTPTQNPHACD